LIRPRGGDDVDKATLKQKARQEMKEFLIISFYLWVVLGVMLLYKGIVLNAEHVGSHITVWEKGFAILNALALGKVVLIARAFHLGEGYDDAPLIFPTLLKSALFSVVLACFKILEEAAVGYFHHKTFQQSIGDLGGGTLQGILGLTIVLFVVLIPFFGYTELQRVLGEGKLQTLFFKSRSAAIHEGTVEHVA
jgi:hypothetical protein